MTPPKNNVETACGNDIAHATNNVESWEENVKNNLSSFEFLKDVPYNQLPEETRQAIRERDNDYLYGEFKELPNLLAPVPLGIICFGIVVSLAILLMNY